MEQTRAIGSELRMETPAIYGHSPIRPETLKKFNDGWQRPTTGEVRSILSACGLTGKTAAELLGLSDSRTIRKWTGGETPIPYACWAILCYKAGYGAIWD